MDLEQLVADYVSLRDKKGEVQAKASDLVAKLDQRLDALELDILSALNDAGVESARTRSGTAYKKVERKTSVSGWNDFLPWIQATGNWHFLNHAANKTAVLEYLDEHEDLPPGITLRSRVGVSINRPKPKR